MPNRLTQARSAYLRSARHQPVDWQQWSPEAFAQAARENKPILLDIGAVWCHWCHVMDRESYENEETAALINQHFIAIKVDRDERPDIDSRYQAAVAAISGQGGWPLTALLTPAGQPFFGGTYFPPTDQHGRAGLRRVLATMAEAFHHQRGEVDETARSVMAAIEENETFGAEAGTLTEAEAGTSTEAEAGTLTEAEAGTSTEAEAGTLTEAEAGTSTEAEAGTLIVIPEGNLRFAQLRDKMLTATLAQFDPRYGGFGSQPKFPNSAALDLLLDAGTRATSPHAAQARHAAMFTLEKMSKGGIYDHLAGGFHRYSVDERWVVPHFEKMSYDNSELLRNYVHAFQSTGERECARIARECLTWIEAHLSDREQGGFYSSQDADYSLDDDGDYFTWTRAEAAAVLTPEELSIVEPFFDLGPLGDMHHNVEKNVLHIDLPLPEIARAAGVTLEQAAARIAQAKAKLYAARQLRPTPSIDRTLYTAWNSMMVTAWLEAGRALNLPAITAFALKSLDRTLALWGQTGMPHDHRSEAEVIVDAIPSALPHPANGEQSGRVPHPLTALPSKGVVSFAAANDRPRLPHVVAYGEGTAEAPPVPGLLDDYLFTAHAALDAWESTGNFRYYEAAESLTEAILEKFHDRENSGFFDTETAAEPQLGALSTRRKPFQDAPTPAGNPVAASLLLRLHELTGHAHYRHIAQSTLASFALVAEHLGLYAAAYAQALTRLIHPHTQVIVVGDDPLAEALHRAALTPYRLTTSILRFRTIPTQLPPALAQLPMLETSYALLCTNQTCQPPIDTPAALTKALQR